MPSWLAEAAVVVVLVGQARTLRVEDAALSPLSTNYMTRKMKDSSDFPPLLSLSPHVL